jgi:hypothetical protein
MVIKSRMRWVRHVACKGEGRGVYRVFVWRPKGKRLLRRRRQKDNIKVDIREIGISETDWI